MDADAKKTALRMIPYGIYVLTADDGKGNVGAATVNWVTQGSFSARTRKAPPSPFSSRRKSRAENSPAWTSTPAITGRPC